MPSSLTSSYKIYHCIREDKVYELIRLAPKNALMTKDKTGRCSDRSSNTNFRDVHLL